MKKLRTRNGQLFLCLLGFAWGIFTLWRIHLIQQHHVEGAERSHHYQKEGLLD